VKNLNPEENPEKNEKITNSYLPDAVRCQIYSYFSLNEMI
jgi:hypothetical protein